MRVFAIDMQCETCFKAVKIKSTEPLTFPITCSFCGERFEAKTIPGRQTSKHWSQSAEFDRDISPILDKQMEEEQKRREEKKKAETKGE